MDEYTREYNENSVGESQQKEPGKVPFYCDLVEYQSAG
jgi:hypothetical protein